MFMSYRNYQTWKDTLQESLDLSIVIPAYNEAERILPTLGAMAVVISGLGYTWEIIVSDDGSKDNTVQLVEELGWKNLRVIKHANTGKGGAVKRGVLASRGNYILFADADNSTPVEELPKLMSKLHEGFDLAIGSRAANGAKEENKNILRHLISWGLRTVAGLLSGVRVKDTQCGFKLFSRDAAQELFQRQQMLGFSFDLELLYLANKLGYKVIEVPVHWFDAPGSKVDSLRDSIRFFRDIFAVKKLDQQGVYERTI
jgi:dolichyl-phosphate beta-glucosyltransferase